MRLLLMLLVTCLTVIALAGCASKKTQPLVMAPAATPEQKAALNLRRGDYREALRLYGEILKEEPKPKRRVALLGVGEAWLGLGNARAALSAFAEVLKEDEENIDALEGCGLAHLGLHDYRSAEAELQRVLAVRPQSWRAMNGLGLIADMKSQYHDAQRWYEQALNVNEDEPSIYNNYGYSLVMAGEYKRAELLLNQALNRTPDNERVRNNLMQAVAWQGEYERAVGLRGGMPLHVALNNVGYIAALRQDHRAAARFYQQALDLSPSWYKTAALNLERLRESGRLAAAAKAAPRR
jgi:Flp pilus assembly protein TadD